MADKQVVLTGWLTKTASATFVVLAAVALYEMRIKPGFHGFDSKFETIVKARVFPEAPNLVIREVYTGVPNVDYGLRFLVCAFIPGVAGLSKEFQVQQMYFLFSFFPLITIYNIEAGRNSLKGSLPSYTSFWALLYQTVGGAVVIPLYHLAFLWKASTPEYYSIQDRNMSPAYHQALAPALLLGYLLPTIIMYLPFPDEGLFLRQGLVAAWQFCPIVVNVLLALFSILFRQVDANKAGLASTTFLYGVSAITAAMAHFYVLYRCFVDSTRLSLLAVLWPSSDMLNGRATDTLHYIFDVDYIVILVSSLLLALVMAGQLCTIRKLKLSLSMFAVSLAVHSLVIGPAATMAACWWWRETRLLRSQKKIST